MCPEKLDHYTSYIELVQETGRCVRYDAYIDIGVSREQDAAETKRGFIADNANNILDLLGLDSDTWLDELKGFKSVGYSAVGTVNQLKEYSAKTQRQWSVGIRLKPALE